MYESPNLGTTARALALPRTIHGRGGRLCGISGGECTMKVQAAVTRAKHSDVSIETLTLEEPRNGEILVRLVATGVCHTDIAIRDQAFPVPQPIVLGHEGAGIVERIGEVVTKVAPGDH